MTLLLAVAGLTIFLLLGVAHAVFTLQSTPEGGPMMPTNPDVRLAMQVPGGLGLAPHIDSNLYRAWSGFNLSHSFGIIGIAGILLAQVVTGIGDAVDQAWFLVASAVVPIVYLILAIRHWFDKPRNGILLGTALLWTGIIIELA